MQDDVGHGSRPSNAALSLCRADVPMAMQKEPFRNGMGSVSSLA
jgi:hypothetical protein